MKHLVLVAAVTFSLGCAGGFIPLLLPLAEKVLNYVVGETPELEFLEDVGRAVLTDDPLEIIWQQANSSLTNPQSKYVMGETDSLGTVDRVVGLVFRSGLLHGMNWDNPDTTCCEP